MSMSRIREVSLRTSLHRSWQRLIALSSLVLLGRSLIAVSSLRTEARRGCVWAVPGFPR